ncbi:MAG: alpha/beta hydrolase [Pseudoruegeria sp.]
MKAAPLYNDVADAPAGGAAYWVKTSDDVQIRVGAWSKGEHGTVLLFPGRTEYIEKYGRAAGEFMSRGFATLVIDWRGQGLADRLTDDVDTGHVVHFTDYQFDVTAAVMAARDLNMPEPYYLFGHSMGGCIGLRALQNDLPVAAVGFSGPMWGIVIDPLQRPFATSVSWLSTKLSLGHIRAPGTGKETYVSKAPFEDNQLTTDPEMFAYMKAQTDAYPDLALGGPSLAWLYEALKECKALMAMSPPDVPTISFLGTNERIVEKDAITQFKALWPNGILEILAGAEHEALMETPAIRNRVFAQITDHFKAHTG